MLSASEQIARQFANAAANKNAWGTILINVKVYGAKGDGETDDTAAIQAAIDAADSIKTDENIPLVYFPPGSRFVTTSTITIPGGIDVVMDSSIQYNGTANEPCLVIGNEDSYCESKRYKLSVIRGTQSDWSDEICIGIKMQNITVATIEIVHAENFTIGVQLLGVGRGFVYNTIFLGNLVSNKYQLDITTDATGWANENIYIGGRFGCGSGVGSGLKRYGVRLKSNNSSNKVNGNVFHKPSFELTQSTASPSESVPVLFDGAIYNRFLECRNEGCSETIACEATNSSSNNYIEFTQGIGTTMPGDVLLDSISVKNIVVNKSGNMLLDNDHIPVFSINDLGRKACYYDGNTRINIPGVFMMDSSSTFTPQNRCRGSIVDDYIDTTFGIGIYVKTDSIKKFTVNINAINSGRIRIKPYDADGTGLDGSTDTYIRGDTNNSFTWNSGLMSGAYTTGSDGRNNIYFEVSADVDYIAFALVGGSGSLKVRSFSITGIGYGATTAWTGVSGGNNNVATTIPTAGTWEVGRIIYNAVPNASGKIGWVCVTSGTPGTWKSFGAIDA